MYNLLNYIFNTTCCLFYRSAYKKVLLVQDIGEVQRSKLFDIIAKNRRTLYGSKYRFENIRTIADFQNQLPVTDYEDYTAYIEKIKRGEQCVLTADKVLLLEITSGSTSASKLIPYTAELKKEFQEGIKPWLWNLYHAAPAMKWGKGYWSITPATTQRRYTEGSIPIGFEDDSEYFGRFQQWLVNRLFAVDSTIAKESDIEQFYFKTSLALLRCRSLSFISVWNPSFLLILLDYMHNHRNELLQNLPGKVVRRIKEPLVHQDYQAIWPQLRIISCWCDAAAHTQAVLLQTKFPNVLLQPKGLLATECFATYPVVGEEGARLSIFSHFFEFKSVDSGELYLAHQLEEKHEYALIVTTGGGLYRYQMHDVVRVIGFSENRTPLLRFIGREGNFSDLYGEKLNEVFVSKTMERVFVSLDFYMFAPAGNHYVLYVKTAASLPDIDSLLRENFHYDYCRKLGQLKPLKIFKLTGSPNEEYLAHCVAQGQRIGDIKRPFLSLKTGWDKVFTGYYEN